MIKPCFLTRDSDRGICYINNGSEPSATIHENQADGFDRDRQIDARTVNVERYRRLFGRAIETVLEPLVGTDTSWLTQVRQLMFDF